MLLEEKNIIEIFDGMNIMLLENNTVGF